METVKYCSPGVFRYTAFFTVYLLDVHCDQTSKLFSVITKFWRFSALFPEHTHSHTHSWPDHLKCACYGPAVEIWPGLSMQFLC